jgi:hypothetical protein
LLGTQKIILNAIDDRNEMTETFEITLSITLTAEDIATAFSNLVPDMLKIDVFAESDTPEQLGAIWAWLTQTD